MRNSVRSEGIVLWKELIPFQWVAICELLKICVNGDKSGEPVLSADDPRFSDWLQKYGRRGRRLSAELKKAFNVISRCDTHLLTGFPAKKDNPAEVIPRVLLLTLEAYKEVGGFQRGMDPNGIPTVRVFLPSPLHIIYRLLADPDEPYTSAYSFTACRDWLAETIGVVPLTDTLLDLSKYTDSYPLNRDDIRPMLNSFVKYKDIYARWPDQRSVGDTAANIKNSFFGFYLSIRGFSYLWFDGEAAMGNFLDSVNNFTSLDFKTLSKKIADTILLPNNPMPDGKGAQFRDLYFRLNSRYEKLPSADEFINQLFGIPVPIKGMDVVFNGGLNPSSSGGLVINVSGEPGTGKTSFCLALSQAFAPLDTTTFYIALEESKSDILEKLKSLSPRLESNLSIQCLPEAYFNCYDELRNDDRLSIQTFDNVVGRIVEQLEQNLDKPFRAGYCPAIVIVDNLNIITNGRDTNDREVILKRLVQNCRRLNAMTILVSGSDLPEEKRLEYLSDIAIEMRFQNLDELNDRPVRIFNLIKSRHQLARQGSHVFHLGSEKGFRIVPHMDSVMDRREILVHQLPEMRETIPALYRRQQNEDGTEALDYSFIDLYPESNILIHGYGSSGKAGLALKILTTPPVKLKKPHPPIDIKQMDQLKNRRRVLIVSFLYPETYYKKLADKLHDSLRTDILNKRDPRDKDKLKTIVDYIVLYPGYLGPQDFISKIVSRIDSAQLEGIPYTGVLVDGLHNVLLQFERLQSSKMVWAMLYSILARYKLTVISTFTNFSLTDEHLSEDQLNVGVQDHLLLQQGMAPFLHALVKATDFYLQLHEVTAHDNERKYVISVRSSIGQEVPKNYLLWNRLDQKVSEIASKAKIDDLYIKPVIPQKPTGNGTDETQ